MPERQLVAVRIADAIVAQSILTIARDHDDVDAVIALILEQLVGIPDHEIQGTAFGRSTSAFEKDLDLAEVEAGHVRRLARGERQAESELVRVEVDGAGNVRYAKRRVLLLAFNVWWCHGAPLYFFGSSNT